MRKRFKKRLLGIILTILMVVSVIPVQQVQTVKAAEITKDTWIYLDVSKNTNWPVADAVFGFVSSQNGTNSDRVLMKKIPDTNIWKGQLQENATKIQFLRLDPKNKDGEAWNFSAWSELVDGKNMFVLNGSEWSNATGTWETYSEGGETPDPTPSTSNTVYYKKSKNSNDTNWDNATNFYVYGFNSDTDKSDIQPMRLTSTAGVYEYTFTKQYAQVIFLRTTRFTSSGKDYSNQTVNLTVPWGEYINPMFTLDGNSDSKDYGKKTGTWSDNTNASTGDEVLKERFYVSTNLVDYINDARLGENNLTRGYSDNNQGTVVNDSNVYSYLDAAISGRPWYTNSNQDSKECKYTCPLYFGNMHNTGNRYGRRLDGKWFGLNNFSVGANVALEESGTEGNKFYGAAAQGLVGNKLVNGKMVDPNDENVFLPYFSGEEIHPYNTAGEIDENKNLSEYYNDLQFPFKQTKDKNGVITYSYDSGKDYAVYYNFEKNCFYESPEHIKNETTNDGTAPEDGFYPLNKPGDPRKAVNMGFGTEFTIPFTLSKDGKINGKDITFNFTGDDDVWVFIDDYLVLDMGGAHRMARGTIDFAQKNVTVERAFTPDKSTTAAWKDGATRANQTSEKRTKKFTQIKTEGKNTFEDIMADDSKVHTLKMFYMERGMFDSNMSVSLNISPIPSGLTLSKDVDTTPVNDGLKSDVETKDNFDFTVKDTDTTRTEYTYEKDYDGTGTERNTTKDGVVKGLADNVYAKNFEYTEADSKGNKGLQIGTNFTITEHENSNYNTRWFVTDISTGDKKGEGNTLTSNFTLGNKDSGVTKVNYNVNFVNTPKVGTVNITKAWNGDVPDTLKNTEFPFKVEVDLDGAAEKDEYSTYALEYTVNETKYKTDANGDFTLKSGQTAAFAGIPTGATVKVTETTTTDEKSWVVSGPNEAESKPVTESSDQTLTITNATKTITSNKVIYVEAGKDTLYKPANVETGYTVSNMSDGLTYTDKGFNGAEPNKSYTANYTGSNKDGAIVNGKITVYTYKATDKVYVFDYGLESNIAETNDNGDGLFQGGIFYNEYAKDANATEAKLDNIIGLDNTQTSITGTNVKIVDNEKADSPVTFKPTAFMDKVENYTYTADITKKGKALESNNPETGTTVNGTIKTMPANVVYYEDDFNKDGENNSAVKIIYSGTKSTDGEKVKLEQSNDQSEQYGHDNAYAKGYTYSSGSSTKMEKSATATFTFKGTGFDIISRTNTETGTIGVKVYKGTKASGTPIRNIPLITYYDDGDLYQVPVIHEKDFDYDTYTVVVEVKSYNPDGIVFYLDGVRIYGPLYDQEHTDDEGNTTYDSDNYLESEVDADINEIRPMIVGNTADETKDNHAMLMQYQSGGNAVLSAGGSTVVETLHGAVPDDATRTTDDFEKYWKWGPNNELYLEPGNAVGFLIPADIDIYDPTDDSYATFQIGAKTTSEKAVTLKTILPDGTEAKDSPITVNSATDMYYKINVTEDMKITVDDTEYYQVVIANTAGGTVSLTNIKSTCDPKLFGVPAVDTTAMRMMAASMISAFSTKDEVVSEAAFATVVRSGRDATLAVTSTVGVEKLKITDSNGQVMDNSTLKISYTDKVLNGNKLRTWRVKFKPNLKRGKYKYTVEGITAENKATVRIGTPTLTVR